jgi:flavin-dependent dehydrogenase
LFLFPGGYGGLSLVEHDAANLCFVVRRTTLHTAGSWDRVLSSVLADNPLIRQRLSSAKALWDRPLALSSIPYGYLANRSSNLWCVGDQAAVIPSFTGDGMSIALHSAALAAEMYLAGQSPLDYCQTLKNQLNRGMSLSVLLSRAMVASATRSLAPVALALFPNVLQWIAASTRIPQQARLVSPVHMLRPRAGT